MTNPSARAWCFTEQVPEAYSRSLETALEYATGWYMEDVKENATPVRYIIWQLERGEIAHRYHLQGYLELNAPKRLTGVKQLISRTAHWEPRRATRDEARNYCRKEDTRCGGPWEHGVWNAKGRGFRSDLASIAEAISAGTLTFANIREEVPAKYCQYRNGIRDLLAHSAQKRARQFRDVHVCILSGPPGCGKTHYAITATNDYFILDPGSNGSNIWFDGYEGQSTLIIDDYYGWIKWTMLLRLLDKYEYRLPVKGGFTYAFWDRIFITSNSHPAEWYNYGRSMSWGALRRRVTEFRMWEADDAEPQIGLLPELPSPWQIAPHPVIDLALDDDLGDLNINFNE